ncbi:hypothetical protein H6F65_00505 [Microcoleus sp. FACHB-DQ6]|nr:hypothetical protein [Microcoleus sp. FACHB-DQ6]
MNRQDACSTREKFSCGTGILPVLNNSARCELQPAEPLKNPVSLILVHHIVSGCIGIIKSSQQLALNHSVFRPAPQQSTVNSQQSTVNSQQSTVNSQQSTVNSQQSTIPEERNRN